jgi:hypothetical protein
VFFLVIHRDHDRVNAGRPCAFVGCVKDTDDGAFSSAPATCLPTADVAGRSRAKPFVVRHAHSLVVYSSFATTISNVCDRPWRAWRARGTAKLARYVDDHRGRRPSRRRTLKTTEAPVLAVAQSIVMIVLRVIREPSERIKTKRMRMRRSVCLLHH